MQDLFRQLTDTLSGMWKFRWQGVIVAWCVAVVAVIAVWRAPDQYEATARIYVDTDSILKPLMSGLTVQPNVEQQVSMLSRTLISRPNIDKLIRMADLDLRNTTKSEQDELADRLMKTIELRTAGAQNLYSMAYRDKEADKAKRVVQSMVSIFVESGLGASRKDTDSAKSFLSEQIRTFEGKLADAEARMKEFRLRNLSTQLDGKDSASRISEIGQQLEAARLQLKEAENARDAARQQLQAEMGQGGSASAMPNLLQGGAPGAPATMPTPELDGRIDGIRRNLDSLQQRYTDKHPDVVAAQKLLKDLEEQRRVEVKELTRKAALSAPAGGGGGSASDSLALQELRRMLAASEVQVASLKARAAEFTARYNQAREAMRTAPQIEAEAAQLNRDYAITKKNYEDLVSRQQAAVMSGELDIASGVADFRLVDPPRVSPRPVAPNRLLLMALAFVASLASGLAFTFVASQLRPVFSNGDELRAKTGLPLLGIVSMLTTDADRRLQRLSLIRFMAASGGLVSLFLAAMTAVSLMTRFGA